MASTNHSQDEHTLALRHARYVTFSCIPLLLYVLILVSITAALVFTFGYQQPQPIPQSCVLAITILFAITLVAHSLGFLAIRCLKCRPTFLEDLEEQRVAALRSALEERQATTVKKAKEKHEESAQKRVNECRLGLRSSSPDPPIWTNRPGDLVQSTVLPPSTRGTALKPANTWDQAMRRVFSKGPDTVIPTSTPTPIQRLRGDFEQYAKVLSKSDPVAVTSETAPSGFKHPASFASQNNPPAQPLEFRGHGIQLGGKENLRCKRVEETSDSQAQGGHGTELQPSQPPQPTPPPAPLARKNAQRRTAEPRQRVDFQVYPRSRKPPPRQPRSPACNVSARDVTATRTSLKEPPRGLTPAQSRQASSGGLYAAYSGGTETMPPEVEPDLYERGDPRVPDIPVHKRPAASGSIKACDDYTQKRGSVDVSRVFLPRQNLNPLLYLTKLNPEATSLEAGLVTPHVRSATTSKQPHVVKGLSRTAELLLACNRCGNLFEEQLLTCHDAGLLCGRCHDKNSKMATEIDEYKVCAHCSANIASSPDVVAEQGKIKLAVTS